MPQKVDDHKKYWDEIVKPDYDEFIRSTWDIRKAFHAATSVNHMADWVYRSNPTYFNRFTFTDRNGNQQPVNNNPTFANYVRDQFSDFEIVRGVSNASKHLDVTQGRHPDAPRSAANTFVRDATWDSGSFDVGSFDNSTVMQEGASGPFPLDDKVTSVYEFWPDFCRRHNMPID